MTVVAALEMLKVWTPFLAGGFAWNILISVAAMAIGTLIGIALARLRLAGSRAGSWLTHITRLPPTFVLIFYFAFILPRQIDFAGIEIAFAAWLKASLALAVAVAGFVSDNALASLRHLRRGERVEALFFLPAWTTYFLIIVMASSTASVIGVPEIVYRANTVIAATGEAGATLWVYIYAMLWFLAFCWPLSWLMARFRDRLEKKGNEVDAKLAAANGAAATEGAGGR